MSAAAPGIASRLARLPRFALQYLKNEILAFVAWRVKILNETVAAEIARPSG